MDISKSSSKNVQVLHLKSTEKHIGKHVGKHTKKGINLERKL